MTDRQIMFSAPMVRALLAGAKTQTRRLMKLAGRHPDFCGGGGRNGPDWNDPAFWGWDDSEHGDWITLEKQPEQRMGWRDWRGAYRTGDRLWVREAWITHQAYDFDKPRDLQGDEPIFYLADGKDALLRRTDLPMAGRYRHGRFMPRWASRLTLTVTDVRLQRLQEISEADAKAEGVVMESADPPFYYVPGIWPHSLTAVGIEHGARHASRSYSKLWNHINGPGAWETNPWVVAITFDVAHQNIDAAAA